MVDLGNLTAEQKARLDALLLLEPAAIERLARIADEDAKREWLFALIRKTAAWVAAGVAGVVVFRDQVASLWRAVSGGGP